MFSDFMSDGNAGKSLLRPHWGNLSQCYSASISLSLFIHFSIIPFSR